MKTLNPSRFHRLTLAAILVAPCLAHTQEKPVNGIDGVKGVKQEAVESVKAIEPPTIQPTAPITVPPVNQVDGVQGFKVPGQAAPPPPAPAVSSSPAAQGVNQVEGIKAVSPNAVQAVVPPPAGAVSTIRAVPGVQGIIAPKQLNLESALLIKEDGKGTPAGGGAEGGKGKAAAAALLQGPAGVLPAPPVPNGDGRAGFQEFEQRTTPGS
jgi:hypothetical protein